MIYQPPMCVHWSAHEFLDQPGNSTEERIRALLRALEVDLSCSHAVFDAHCRCTSPLTHLWSHREEDAAWKMKLGTHRRIVRGLEQLKALQVSPIPDA